MLTPATYYEDKDYLSNSALNNFCSFDIFGNPVYNMQEFLNPTPPESMAITIGTICDRILTEGFNLDDEYWPTLDKAWMKAQLDLMEVDYKSDATNPILRRLLEINGYKFKKELPNGARDSIETIINRARNFQYDANTTFMEFIQECDCQKICVSEDWWVKGKFDFLNRKRNLISDLKTTGNLDRIMKELIYKGQPNIYHKYVRQLAIYQELYFLETGLKYQCELIFIDYKWHHRIVRIGQRALDKALAQVRKDIDVLREVYTGERAFTPIIDIDEATEEVLDSHTTPVMLVMEEDQEGWPDYLTSFE